jgi:hypothetical protein
VPVITGGKVIEGARQEWRANAGVGSGPFSSPGAPAGGYLNNVAQPGALCINQANGTLYVNTGTLAVTVWTLQGSLI